MFGIDALAQTSGIGRSALEREVLATHSHGPAVDPAQSDDVVRWYELLELAAFVKVSRTGHATLFVETVRIQNAVDTLADRQLASVMLPSNGVLATLL